MHNSFSQKNLSKLWKWTIMYLPGFFRLRDIPHSLCLTLCLQWLTASRVCPQIFFSWARDGITRKNFNIRRYKFHVSHKRFTLPHFTRDLLQAAVNRQMNERYGSSFSNPTLRYFYSFESDISLVPAYTCPSVLEFFPEWPCRNSAIPTGDLKSEGPLNGYKRCYFSPRATIVWMLPRLTVSDRVLFAHDAYWISWLSWRAASFIGEDNDRSVHYVNAFCRHNVVTKSWNALGSVINLCFARKYGILISF